MREPKDNSFGAYQELNIHLSRIQDLEKKVAKQTTDIKTLEWVFTIFGIVIILALMLTR